MFKYTKLLLTIFCVFAVGALHADISSVGFVHAKILELKGIDLPIPTGVTADQVNSVHYLMTQIDAVNAQNGITTNYADGPDAVQNLTTSARVIADVTELIVDAPCPEDAFCVTLSQMTASSAFSFSLSAAGNFTIDWDDGSTVETLTRADTTATTYSHTYTAAGNYRVTINGLATAYSSTETTAAISFRNSTNSDKITAISGDLGKIFPVLNTSATGSPRFYQTFSGCTYLTGIPTDLFASVQGAPTKNMFNSTFAGCTRLTGEIPPNLFAGISGPPAHSMFFATFSGCTRLTGEIPSGLFANISGTLAGGMFARTFSGCQGLTGEIPSGLFGTFTGTPMPQMFEATFSYCTGLTSIADGIWDLSGMGDTPAFYMFANTFQNCTNITSASPNIAPGSTEHIYDMFWLIGTSDVYHAFSGCTNMADYASIPAVWK